MCGLAGVLGFAAAAERSALDRMALSMAHRGPDGAGQWWSADGRVGVAHRRLSIVDLTEAGAQPMRSEDGRYVVVFNGEIYNHRDLRASLAAQGARFHSTSDTEVLLQLFAREGAQAVRRLRGMFAFALWDVKDRRLFLARDHFGIKPLYYARGVSEFRFASQVSALLAGGGVDTAEEPAGHVGFFLFGSVPEPWTLYRGIRALPAGCLMWVDADGRGEPERYWSVAAALESPPPSAAIPELGEALRDSVRHHLIADVPVGLFLSAGRDSSTLVALATELQPEPPRTVTLGFEEYSGTANDEVPLAEQVAKHYGAIHTTRRVPARDFLGRLDDIVAAMDQPSIDGVNTYLVSLVTAQSGLKVALSGLGADEMFGGYSTFRDVPRTARRTKWARFVPGFGRLVRVATAGIAGRMGKPKHAGLLEYGATEAGGYLLRRGLYMPWELPEVLDPEIVRLGWKALDPITQVEVTRGALRSAWSRMSAVELSWYMRNQLLRDADWAGMAHSLEIRVPFVDVRLFEAIAGMHAAGKFPTKQDMANVPRVALPPEVLRRPKTGFGIPVREWLNQLPVAGTGEAGLRGWAKFLYARKVKGVAA